jgi:hypothetical protein
VLDWTWHVQPLVLATHSRSCELVTDMLVIRPPEDAAKAAGAQAGTTAAFKKLMLTGIRLAAPQMRGKLLVCAFILHPFESIVTKGRAGANRKS